MKITVGFVTGRRSPQLAWAIDAIGTQCLAGDEVDVVVVDALAGQRPVIGEAELLALDRWPQILQPRVVLPKPNPWQGPHRLTDRDWWAMSNARNTVFALARHDYVACMDDCARPGPRWLAAVRQGYERRKSVIAGSYEKWYGPPADRRYVNDHRRERYPEGRKDCGGGWLYGCTFALPIAWALEVNGFEEGMDSLTMEDVIFGMMLERCGRRIDFSTDLHVLLDRAPDEVNSRTTYACTDKGVSPRDKSHAAIDRFGKRKRTEFTPNLAAIRIQFLTTGTVTWPLPDPEARDWFDGQLVRTFLPGRVADPNAR